MFKLLFVFAVFWLLFVVIWAIISCYKSEKAKRLAEIKLKNALQKAEAQKRFIHRQNLITMYRLQNCAIRLRMMQMLKRVDPVARKHCKSVLMVAMLQYNFPKYYSENTLVNIDIIKLEKTLSRHETLFNALNKVMLQTPTDGSLTANIIFSSKSDMNYSIYLKSFRPDPVKVRMVQSYIDKIFYKIPEDFQGLDDYDDISLIL